MDNSTNGNGHVKRPQQTYRELARRQKAACVAVACEHGVTLQELRADPVLAAWATSVFIQGEIRQIPLNPDVSLDLPRRIVAVNGTNR